MYLKTNEIIEHFNFFSRKQQEQFGIWYTDLKKVVKSCDFGKAEDKIFRIQIVLSIYDKEIQTRILRDDGSFLKMVLYCQSVERAENSRRTVNEADKIVHAAEFKLK